MFGLLDLFTKQVNDQIAAYAAAQADVARRVWENWLDPFQAAQPVRIDTNRRLHGVGMRRDNARRR